MEENYIETAHNIQIRQSPATVGTRILAQVIDFFIIGVYLILVSITAFFILKIENGSIAVTTLLILPFLLYHLLFEIFMNGQSIGKYTMEIRVVQLDGTRATIGSYLLRWILRPVDITLSSGGIALLTILLGGKGQRLGDLAAGTTVISLKQEAIKREDLLTKVNKEHEPKYPQVINLNDSQLTQIKKIRIEALKSHDFALINKLAEKTSTLLQVSYDTKPLEFIDQLILDYEYFAQKEYGEV
ncbi:putative RDD family protein [Algoriphagus machipongonensis]|uniref:RDD family protein n=2 Tax=Algoriphagus machipongonensis TaxID=388413 RepID=A3HYT0_9BACT|nr:putative RDD family protein [Algoriphagus machipongonensis]